MTDPRIAFQKSSDKAIIPEYKTIGSSGMDLCNIDKFSIKPNERRLVDTGLRVSIPKGFEGQIRPRSGLALNHGITVLNSPGTIDSDYRGDLKVLLINLGTVETTFDSNTRIAQLVIAPVGNCSIIVSDNLEETERGTGGFGSTGIK